MCIRDSFKSIKQDFQNVRLIFLNACLTESLAKSISELDIEAIGTVEKLRSTFAIPFASGFYKLYSKEKSLEQSARHGLRQCELKTDQNPDEIIAVFRNGKQVTI